MTLMNSNIKLPSKP